MSEHPQDPQQRAAQSGAGGYTSKTDDELNALEIEEGAIGHDRGKKGGAGGPGGMMPPMMGGAGAGGAGAGAGQGGALGAGGMGMPGVGLGTGGTMPAGSAMGGVGRAGAGSFGGAGGSFGGGGGVGGTRAADGSSSDYGINPSTGLPWQPGDPGYPGATNPGGSAPGGPGYPGYPPYRPGDPNYPGTPIPRSGDPTYPPTDPAYPPINDPSLPPGPGDPRFPRPDDPSLPPGPGDPGYRPPNDPSLPPRPGDPGYPQPSDPTRPSYPSTPTDNGGGWNGETPTKTFQVDTGELDQTAKDWADVSKDFALIQLAADGLKLENDAYFLGTFPLVHESGRTIFMQDAAVVEQNASGISGTVAQSAADYAATDQMATDAANRI